MKKFLFLFKNSSHCFYLISSIFIFVLLLNQFHFFEWLIQFIEVLKPLFIGGVMAFFLQPLISPSKKKSIGRIIFVYLIFILLFLLIFFLVFLLALQSVPGIIRFMNDAYPVVLKFMEKISILDYIDMNQIQQVLMNGYSWLMPFIQSFLSFLTTFSLSVMISFFISIESDRITNEIIKYVKNYEKLFELYHIFSLILRQYVYSTLLDALFIIVTTSLILWLFHTPYALLMAVVLAFMNLFPYIGAILGNILIILIHLLLVKENTSWLILALFINSQLEGNVIHAWICNKTMKVHPLFLFTALLVNEYLFGIIGIILSPIVASIFQMCFITYSEYLNKKNIGGWENIIS